MKQYYSNFLFCLSTTALLISCTKTNTDILTEKATGCTTTPISYSSDIVPLFTKNCSTIGCHRDGFSVGDFTTYNGIIAVKDNIKREVQSGKMPKAGALSESEIQKITCWIDAGALEN